MLFRPTEGQDDPDRDKISPPLTNRERLALFPDDVLKREFLPEAESLDLVRSLEVISKNPSEVDVARGQVRAILGSSIGILDDVTSSMAKLTMIQDLYEELLCRAEREAAFFRSRIDAINRMRLAFKLVRPPPAH